MRSSDAVRREGTEVFLRRLVPWREQQLQRPDWWLPQLHRGRGGTVDLLHGHGTPAGECPLGRESAGAGIHLCAGSRDELEGVVVSAAPEKRALGVSGVDCETGELSGGAGLVRACSERLPDESQQRLRSNRLVYDAVPAESAECE